DGVISGDAFEIEAETKRNVLSVAASTGGDFTIQLNASVVVNLLTQTTQAIYEAVEGQGNSLDDITVEAKNATTNLAQVGFLGTSAGDFGLGLSVTAQVDRRTTTAWIVDS
ncbi:unnamed protein product, partial [Chrysoparadoxa australica]